MNLWQGRTERGIRVRAQRWRLQFAPVKVYDLLNGTIVGYSPVAPISSREIYLRPFSCL